MEIKRTGDLFDIDFTIELDADIARFTEIVDRVDWLPLLTPMVERAYYLNTEETELLMDLRTCLLWKCWYLTKISQVIHKPNLLELQHSDTRDSFIVAHEFTHYSGTSQKTTIRYEGKLQHKFPIPSWISIGLIEVAAKFEVGRGAKRLERALNGETEILSTPF